MPDQARLLDFVTQGQRPVRESQVPADTQCLGLFQMRIEIHVKTVRIVAYRSLARFFSARLHGQKFPFSDFRIFQIRTYSEQE